MRYFIIIDFISLDTLVKLSILLCINIFYKISLFLDINKLILFSNLFKINKYIKNMQTGHTDFINIYGEFEETTQCVNISQSSENNPEVIEQNIYSVSAGHI